MSDAQLNWDAISAVAEVIGALAVIATLIYLARQISQNTAALRSTATQAANEQAAEMYRTMATDSSLAAIFIRGMETPEELSDVESAQFNSLWMYVCFDMQNWYLQTQGGFLDGSLLESWGRLVPPMCSQPGFQSFWEQRGHIYTPEFRRFLESLVPTERDTAYRPLGVRRTHGSEQPDSS